VTERKVWFTLGLSQQCSRDGLGKPTKQTDIGEMRTSSRIGGSVLEDKRQSADWEEHNGVIGRSG